MKPAEFLSAQLDAVGKLYAGYKADIARLQAKIDKLEKDVSDTPSLVVNKLEFFVNAGNRAEPGKDAYADCGNAGVVVGGSCVGYNTSGQLAIGPVYLEGDEQSDTSKGLSKIRCQTATSRPRAFAVCMRLRK